MEHCLQDIKNVDKVKLTSLIAYYIIESWNREIMYDEMFDLAVWKSSGQSVDSKEWSSEVDQCVWQ
jgi:hypothetical protein